MVKVLTISCDMTTIDTCDKALRAQDPTIVTIDHEPNKHQLIYANDMTPKGDLLYDRKKLLSNLASGKIQPATNVLSATQINPSSV